MWIHVADDAALNYVKMGRQTHTQARTVSAIVLRRGKKLNNFCRKRVTQTHTERAAHIPIVVARAEFLCASGLWSLDPLAYSNSILFILCREIDWHADRQTHGTHLTKCDRRNFASNLICPVVKCPSPFTVYSKCMLYTNSCLYVRRSCATARVVLKERTSDEVAASIFWGNLLLHLSWKFGFIFCRFTNAWYLENIELNATFSLEHLSATFTVLVLFSYPC